jgi:prepilin-type N-terminal cleavage/methylation domain-containing protein
MQKVVRGFTLVEMLVSVALFSIVMLIGLGALLTLVDQNRHAQALNAAMTNLNFALESMSRTIRTGTGYQCAGGGDCVVSGGNSITFTSQDGDTITYEYVSGSSALYRCFASSCNSGNRVRLTGPDVTISYARFYVRGSALTPGDTTQAHVIMTIVGSVATKNGVQGFNVQTTVTQRLPDL